MVETLHAGAARAPLVRWLVKLLMPFGIGLLLTLAG